MRLVELFETWDHYTAIGHTRGSSIVWYMMPGGKMIQHPFLGRRSNHDGSAEGDESRAIAVGRIDPKKRKISVRTPLAPGNSFIFLSEPKLAFIRKQLERDYPDYEIWYFGHGASDIRRIDRNQEQAQNDLD
jgi:hypothetical protein